jgi:hypothetical protein
VAHEHVGSCLKDGATVHLTYKLRHLAIMATAHQPPGNWEEPAVLAFTGMFEGFLVHARNVDGFLANRGDWHTG